jgi:hypothetical protein
MGEPRHIGADELAASFACAVNAFVQHYWTCRKDYLVSVDNLVEGSGQGALEQMSPNWKEDLVKEYCIGVKPEATMKLYTSSTNVVIRRVFRNCSLEPDGVTIFPRSAELPLLFKPGQNKRPMTMNSSDEAGKNTKMLFRPFEFPKGIPGIENYQTFIETNFSEWSGNKPVHFFERKPFYRALNCAISQDAQNVLAGLMCIITDMNWFINQTRHDGGIQYSGVGLGQSMSLVSVGAKLRMPRFLSTTKKIEFAQTRVTDKVCPALLVIRVPSGFWGARDITSFSSCAEEEETIFCAHALFEVEAVTSMPIDGKDVVRITLKALDKYDENVYDESAYPTVPATEMRLRPSLAWSRSKERSPPLCMTPGCTKPTWNEQADGHCSRSCKMKASQKG